MRSSSVLARGLLAFGLLVSPACLSSGSGQAGSGESSPGEPDSTAAVSTLEGTWGGEGIRLALRAAGGTLEFDCGSATIENLVVSRSKRRFRAEGKVYPATGGPAIYPPPPGREPRSVKFRGRVEGERLRLTVVRPKPRREGEPRKTVYRLDQGSAGQLAKCR